MDKPTILIIDDDDVDIEAVLRAIKRKALPYQVAVAHDGENAFDLLHGKYPHNKLNAIPLIILDLNMPRMNGLEFLDKLRTDPCYACSVVFVLTTSAHPKDIEAAYNKNIAGYLIKSRMGNQYEKLSHLLEKYHEAVLTPTHGTHNR